MTQDVSIESHVLVFQVFFPKLAAGIGFHYLLKGVQLRVFR